jgi:3-methyladenine DNA glycosylase AlkC
MAEPFKSLINPALVQTSAEHLARQAGRLQLDFDTKRFVKAANQGLEVLELKARAMQIASALQATLPQPFEAAATLLEAALAPPEAGDAMAGLQGVDQGLRGWICWPVGEFIAREGITHPQRALQSLHAMTQRFTAEWALRPFIVAHPDITWPTLARWSLDASPHVRRLVSEGSRPRLPWGLQLRELVADPSPTLPLLLALQDDPSEYVRRSVANHLNDIAKDHPELVAQWVATHLPQASRARQALLRHASRSLIKAGHSGMLKAWGLGQALRGTAALDLQPPQLALGESLHLTLTLRSTAKAAQKLAVDYAVHHVKADGSTRPKVFKGWQLELAPGAQLSLSKRHTLKPITTRRYHAGTHALAVHINGQEVARAAFVLHLPD